MLDIMMPLLEGETVTYHGRYYSVDDLFIEPRTVAAAGVLDRRRLAARGPEVARPAEVRRVGQGADPPRRRLDPAAHLPAARTSPRDWDELQALLREHGRDPSELPRRARELPAPRADERPGEGPRGAAPGVPQGHERRARAGLPRVGLPVRDAGRDRRLAPGARRRRRRVLHPPHDDARPGAAPATGSTRSSRTSSSRPTAGPVRVAAHGAVAAMTRTGRPPRQAAQAASLAGHARRRVRRGRDRRALRAAASSEPRTRSRLPSRRRVVLTASASASPRRTSRVVAGAVRRGRARRAGRSAPSTTSSRTDDGRLVGFNTDAPGFRAGVELAMGRPLARRDVVVAGRRRGGPCGRLRVPEPRASTGSRSATGRRPRRRRWRRGSRGVGSGSTPRWPSTTRRSATRSARPTSRSTRRPSGWSTPGSTIDVDAPARSAATVFDLVYVPAETPLRRRGAGRAACAPPTAPRCSSRRPRSRSSAGPASAGWPTSCATAVAPLLADPGATA